MKFFAAALVLGAIASAAPTEVEARTGGGNGNQNNSPCANNGDNKNKLTCCNGDIAILDRLLCDVGVLGDSCDSGQTTYCCNNDAPSGLVNINALNCVHAH